MGRLLADLGYALHAGTTQRGGRAGHRDRDAQGGYIAAQRQACREAGLPVVSVDTKERELLGDFKNAGRAWSRRAAPVHLRDFPQAAPGGAVPSGLYALAPHHGAAYAGASAATPQFAVDVPARWWAEHGRARPPAAAHLLALADGGGGNGARSRPWKQQLQAQLCDQHGLAVTGCHYPPGCSKWNPVERRLFSHIGLSWAGQPPRTWEILLAYLRGATTATGLTVDAGPHEATDTTGRQVTDAELAALYRAWHSVCPAWGYTLRPRTRDAPDPPQPPRNREVIP